MPITSVDKDPQALTLTVVADFPVPVRRLWDAYADPGRSRSSGARRSGRPRSPGTTSPSVAGPATS